jgi:hypothetical protein
MTASERSLWLMHYDIKIKMIEQSPAGPTKEAALKSLRETRAAVKAGTWDPPSMDGLKGL